MIIRPYTVYAVRDKDALHTKSPFNCAISGSRFDKLSTNGFCPAHPYSDPFALSVAPAKSKGERQYV